MYEMFENLGFAFAYPAVYFKCKYMAYPVSSGEGKLPDFGNMTAQERIQQDYLDMTTILKKWNARLFGRDRLLRNVNLICVLMIL